MKVPQNRLVVSCPVANGCPGATAASPTGTYYYLFKYFPNECRTGRPSCTGKDLADVGDPRRHRPDDEPVGRRCSPFTGHGSKQFQKITKAEYQRGQATRDARRAAGEPQLRHRSTPATRRSCSTASSSRRRTSTSRDPTLAERHHRRRRRSSTGSQSDAKNLALVLQTGALPYNFQQIERTDVSSTLGKDSLTQAWHAALVGLIVVAIFLLLLYRFLGLVAVFGLAIYAALYYAAILLFNVTLTLPGFAGLILTIGVAADANVVVFERIKEEVRSGKSVRAAIAAGYGKGFHTILDANVVTAITALVLFLIAVASVKGFALMLLIGTAISLLTAVAATRAMLGLLSGFRWFDNPRFMGAHGQQTAKWLQIDFMRRRYLWFAISGVIIVAGAASLGVRGLNLGIDFKGGTQLSFKTHTAQTTTEVRQIAAADGQPDAVVQGTRHVGQRQVHVLAGADEVAQGRAALDADKRLPAPGRRVRERFEGRVVELRPPDRASTRSGGSSSRSLLIIIYITLRFDIKFAVPVIIAMLHDILITVGLYSLVFKEVTIDTVAAVLTVLGYSIYDTIIIFDRIRENVPLMRRQPFATIANVSLWETIRRSLATTFITLLPIAALEVLGGSTLKDFAFALIIGVTSGAYSSIFIAAPLLTIWKEREPEYARRKQLHGSRRARGRVRGRPAPPRSGKLDAGDVALEQSEQALADEPTPELVDVVTATPSEPSAQARREKRSSAAARGRTAVPGSARIVEALEELLDELPARVRGGRARFGEQTVSLLRSLVEELNLVTRDDLDELELRVAQLEHRLAIARRAARRAAGVGRRGPRVDLEALDVVHDVRADRRERQLAEHRLEHRLEPSRRPSAR